MRLSLCARAARRSYHRQHSTSSAHVHTCIIVSPHTHRHKARKRTQQKTPKRSRFEEESSAKRQVRWGGWGGGGGWEGAKERRRKLSSIAYTTVTNRHSGLTRWMWKEVRYSTVRFCSELSLRSAIICSGTGARNRSRFLCVCVCVCVSTG